MSPTDPTRTPIDLSIVIVNHNTSRLLETCLRSICDTVGPLDCEIFVVDNASSDGSVEMVRERFPEVHLVANTEGLGFTRAVNQVLPRASGDFVLIAHPDVAFLPGTIPTSLSSPMPTDSPT